MITLSINDKRVETKAAEDTPLLWILRDHLNMTGTKFGCGMALCGACTVDVAGEPVRSCTTPISAVAGKKITTIEAIGATRVGRAVQDAWVVENVPQCGYCQSGQVMAAAALLRENKKPTDAQIDEAMNGNLCRCASYPRIRAAIKRAARTLTS